MKKFLLFASALLASVAMSAATWNVTVPEGTKACYIAGDLNGWTFSEMTKVDDTHYTITVETDKTDGYKYTSGPDWAYVEKNADGSEITENRSYNANDVVARWASVYDPGVAVSYVDITIRVQADAAPTIWWWGAGDKCPNAQDVPGMSYTWDNQPVMTAVAGQTGWFEWIFKDVNASLGVTFKLNSGDKEINAKESACYNVGGDVIACGGDEPGPQPSGDYYVTGNEALVGADKAWNVQAIALDKVDGIYTHTFSNVVAGIECQLKVNNGTWDSAWGYDDLTTVPEGVTRGAEDNNIIFTLAEAGDVKIKFDAEAQKITLSFEVGTSISATEATIQATKVIRNGQVLIIRDGVAYDMMGQEVK